MLMRCFVKALPTFRKQVRNFIARITTNLIRFRALIIMQIKYKKPLIIMRIISKKALIMQINYRKLAMQINCKKLVMRTNCKKLVKHLCIA
jgi:hypothetical protein